MTVEDRVERILTDYIGDDKRIDTRSGQNMLAARHLFSTLSHLEHLAELAAERGDCIEGQLEDERVHRIVFRRLAEIHGGLEPCPAPAQKLIDYISGLEGEMSLATLNLVAESWLDTVFHHLEGCSLARTVFESIEEDEARHTYGALQSARPDPEQIEPVLRDLEKLLIEISVSGEFMLPMAWFLGPAGVSRMGLDICRAHERACQHLGVSPDLYDLEVSCRAARFLDRTAPAPWPMNEWERLKFATFDKHAPQLCFVDAETRTENPVRLQAEIIHALGRILAREPELRKVQRAGSLFVTDHPVVGMRALYDDDRVITMFISRPERYNPRKLVGMLNKQLKRFKSKPYEPYDGPIAIAPHLSDLLPPNRCSVVISYNGKHGGLYGYGPLSEHEGIPCSVTIGEPHWKPITEDGKSFCFKRVVTLCVQMDHRVGDGRHIGLLAKSLVTELDMIQR